MYKYYILTYVIPSKDGYTYITELWKGSVAQWWTMVKQYEKPWALINAEEITRFEYEALVRDQQ